MHHKGGVSKAVKFSLAGNIEAIAAAVEKNEPILVCNRCTYEFFPRKIHYRLDLRSTRFRPGHISLTSYEERACSQVRHRTLAGGGILPVCKLGTSAEQRPFRIRWVRRWARTSRLQRAVSTGVFVNQLVGN